MKGDLKPQFIELRSAGFSLAAISGKIGVSKTTLVKWNIDLEKEVAEATQESHEALVNRLALGRKARLFRLSDALQDVQDEILKRDLASVPTGGLLRLYLKILDQVRTETSKVELSLSFNPIQEIWKECLRIVDDGEDDEDDEDFTKSLPKVDHRKTFGVKAEVGNGTQVRSIPTP